MTAPTMLDPSSQPASHAATGSPGINTPDVLAALRDATAALHTELDASLAISTGNASLHDYALHLQAVRGWLAALAPSAAPVDAVIGSATRREQAIALDLVDCAAQGVEMAHPAAGIDAGVMHTPAACAAQGDAWCWGARYVVEGSALGGLVLRKRLAQALHPHPLRYLEGEGAATAQRWRGFIEALRAHVVTPEEVACACAGAVAAFADFSGRMRAQTRVQPS